jgi:hypothetical protein
VGTQHKVRLFIVQNGMAYGMGARAAVPLLWSTFPADGSPYRPEYTYERTTLIRLEKIPREVLFYSGL